MKNICIFSENNLFFYLKIKNKIPNDFLEELEFGYNIKNLTKNFSI